MCKSVLDIDKIKQAALKNLSNFFPIEPTLSPNQPECLIRTKSEQFKDVQILNMVYHSQCSFNNIDQIIREILEDYASMNLPALWRVSDYDQPSNLEKRLKEIGFEYQQQIRVMGIDHTDLDLTEIQTQIESSKLQIKFVPSEEIEEFLDVFIPAYQFPNHYKESVRYFLTNIVQLDVYGKKFFNYMGYINNTPVSTSTLFLNNDIAGIYNISTLPRYRRKGYGELMTLDLLKRAIEYQYPASCLTPTELSEGLYKRIGFNFFTTSKLYSYENF